MKERALLVTVDFQSAPRETSLKDFSEELDELARSAGLEVVGNMTARQKAMTSSLLVGGGKAEEIAQAVTDNSAGVVVFGNTLSATQQRNLEAVVRVKTIDRTQLILDIFAQRAKSSEGKLQVELAQLQYLLPRLSGKGIELSRLGGGVGTRGPGEQKLEMDRRRIRERISRLSRELVKLQKRHSEGIQKKQEKGLPLVALVGYTNAGKSTLFNALTQSSVTVKDQLFSTLDATTRLLTLPGNQKVLLADTVGFVRELPHHLIESFKATLEEARHADLLLHVVDAARPDAPALVRAVQAVLAQLRPEAGRTVLVMNKSDLVNAASRESGHWVSALTGEGLENLRRTLEGMLFEGRRLKEVFIPHDKLGQAHYLYEHGEVLERKDDATGAHFKVRLTDDADKTFRHQLNRSGA